MAVQIDRAEERAIHQRLSRFRDAAWDGVSLQTLLTVAYMQGMQDACEVLAQRTRPIDAETEKGNDRA